jgi:pyruvate dehydrogenase E2 component (dihydrolipoyllysine-residue acetyltransferase)
MAISVVMPALELTQETGKLVAWRKKEGERVAKGEPLLEVETDKAVVEIESPAEGILAGIRAEQGAVIPVGQTIAWIVEPGEAAPSDGAAPNSESRAVTRAQPSREPAVRIPQGTSRAGTKISPKARRLAQEKGVDVSKLEGSGSGGEILACDILAAAESKGATSPPPTKAAGSVVSFGSIGRLMAERTTQSWTSVPHFFVVREVDAGALLEAREQLLAKIEKTHGARPTHTDMLVALVARTLAKHPRMNASWTSEGPRLNPQVNVAVAMAVEDGVVAAVIHNADAAALEEIVTQRRELRERARANKLRPADISGATFTISNLGMYHVDAFTAIIHPPQAGILAVGRIADRVVPRDGRPGIRPMVTLTLSCDHRVVDGARAAEFLNDFSDSICEAGKHLR